MNPALEALDFIRTLEPAFSRLDDSARKTLAGNLIADLTRISVLCGYADDEFTEDELLVAMLYLASVFAFFTGEAFGAFQSAAVARNYLQHWTSLESETRERVVGSLTAGLEKHFDRALGDIDLERFVTPASLRHLDKQRGSNTFDPGAAAMYRFAQVLVKIDGNVLPAEEQVLKKIWRLLFAGTPAYSGEAPGDIPAQAVAQATGDEGDGPSLPAGPDETKTATPIAPAPPEESLEDVLAELDELIGLDNIKGEVRTLINFLQLQKEREKRDMPRTPVSLHMVFTGPPGTGKTTVARLIARIYRALKLLDKGHLVETDRAGLVGSYVGHTSKKVAEKVEEALHGILFIDEAYALKPEGDSGRDFGQEAIDILLKRMEDHREELVVIAAGYSDEMTRFIESNPGLKSRFNRYLHFDHYGPDELLKIFRKFCEKANYTLHAEAQTKLLDVLTRLYEKRDRTFGNGRLARNLFEKVIERQANRLAGVAPLTDEAIAELAAADIPDFPADKSAGWFQKLLEKIGLKEK